MIPSVLALELLSHLRKRIYVLFQLSSCIYSSMLYTLAEFYLKHASSFLRALVWQKIDEGWILIGLKCVSPRVGLYELLRIISIVALTIAWSMTRQLFRQPVVIHDNNQVIVALWNWNKSICQIILLSIVAHTITLLESHYSANRVLLLLLNNLVIRLDFFEQNPHLKMFFNKIVSSAFKITLWV